jgi:hypothetical protein
MPQAALSGVSSPSETQVAPDVLFPIEDGIPIPTRRWGKPKKYYLERLEVGQSMFVPLEKGFMGAAIMRARRVTGRRFTQRRAVNAEGTLGVRIWRIA